LNKYKLYWKLVRIPGQILNTDFRQILGGHFQNFPNIVPKCSLFYWEQKVAENISRYSCSYNIPPKNPTLLFSSTKIIEPFDHLLDYYLKSLVSENNRNMLKFTLHLISHEENFIGN
jgi:hypothetical protein